MDTTTNKQIETIYRRAQAGYIRCQKALDQEESLPKEKRLSGKQQDVVISAQNRFKEITEQLGGVLGFDADTIQRHLTGATE